ncbi:TPA: GTPase Era [Candidatus Ventrenecus stercoripullorum]|nr:GTPase Era [Candidatus Ventrenecus stercoripullorum]
MKSGFVSIIGRPNVGKSTLLNAILDFKVAIISNKAGTTRNIIQGIYNDLDTQIVFMDTPGIHKPKNKLGKFLNKESYALTKDVDAILFVVDAKEGIGTGDRFILETLKKSETPVILVLNKIDCLNNEGIIGRIEEYKDIFPFAEIVPVSALKKDNVGRLIEVIKKYLTDNVRYFDDDMVTSNSMSFMASELVREKLLNVTIEEIPHSITCVTTKFESHSSIVNICVDIIVDRDSIKKIIIGKGGERLKLVGSEARKELEAMLGKKVYLELYVRTIKNWREKTSYLKELGFNELDLK